ncbi:MAG TPA: hypothetical protein VNR39_12150 [Pseudolabrys sp.]|nr:hypothetical protein [Pseudolabrys sp.]
MSTLAELQAHRDTAGADFASAFAAFKAAWVNLRAHEIALANAKVKAPTPTLRRIRKRGRPRKSQT